MTALSQMTNIATSLLIERVADRARWDAAIDALRGSLLQTWDWGEFKSLHGWRPVRLLGASDGEPAIAIQILVRDVGPFTVLYAPRGPSFIESDDATLSALTLAIDRLASTNHATIAFIEPEKAIPGVIQDDESLDWIPAVGELQPLRTIKVPIDRSDDDILAGMKSKTRYNVRLAGRRGVTVRRGEPAEIVPFYELLEETGDRDAFGIHGIEYYADMLGQFGDRAALLLAQYDGELAAGAIVLTHGEEAIYMFGASTKKHQRHMPSHLLQFEAMRWARVQGCSLYDLWGIPDSDAPPEEADGGDLNVRSGLWGVYRFKQGFGGDIVTYPGVYERQYYPRLIKLWRRMRPGLGL
jgi:peptidoglycan pentaglycine glycine transferase (the first glycine)